MRQFFAVFVAIIPSFYAPPIFGEERQGTPNQLTYDAKTHTYDVSTLVGPDPWLIHYGRFTADHSECSAVSGSVLISPDDIRFLAFYDDTHESPMVLSPMGDQPEPNVMISNAVCRLGLSVSRSLGWNRDGGSAPGMTGGNQNKLSAQLPEMLTVIRYSDANSSCTPLELPFFINHNLISFPQTQRLLLGYLISMRVQEAGQYEDLIIERPGCAMRIRLTLQVLHNAAWQIATFRY